MNLPRSRMMGAAASLAVVAAAAGVTLGVTTLLGVTFGGGGSGAAESLPAGRQGAPPAARDAPDPAHGGDGDAGPTPIPSDEWPSPKTMCVQTVNLSASAAASVEADAPARIEAALEIVAQNPYWEVVGLDRRSLRVDIGCPSMPPEPLPGFTAPPIEVVFGYEVPRPGEYSRFIFILPPDELRALVGQSERRWAMQEFVRVGDSIEGTAAALYISSEELNDIPLLAKLFEYGMGLPEE
jgi:hypothetical protein